MKYNHISLRLSAVCFSFSLTFMPASTIPIGRAMSYAAGWLIAMACFAGWPLVAQDSRDE